jgi:hypothetical protein
MPPTKERHKMTPAQLKNSLRWQACGVVENLKNLRSRSNGITISHEEANAIYHAIRRAEKLADLLAVK